MIKLWPQFIDLDALHCPASECTMDGSLLGCCFSKTIQTINAPIGCERPTRATEVTMLFLSPLMAIVSTIVLLLPHLLILQPPHRVVAKQKPISLVNWIIEMYVCIPIDALHPATDAVLASILDSRPVAVWLYYPLFEWLPMNGHCVPLLWVCELVRSQLPLTRPSTTFSMCGSRNATVRTPLWYNRQKIELVALQPRRMFLWMDGRLVDWTWTIIIWHRKCQGIGFPNCQPSGLHGSNYSIINRHKRNAGSPTTTKLQTGLLLVT